MQGHFDLKMLHTPSLTQRVIDAARKEGGDPAIEALLRKMPVDGEWHTDNLIYQVTPGYLFNQAMSGPTSYGTAPTTGTASALLGVIVLTSDSSAPSYIEAYDLSGGYIQNLPNAVGTGCGMRFLLDSIVAPDIKSDPAGCASIYIKSKWLFLPGYATSDQIKSVVLYGISASGMGGNVYPYTSAYGGFTRYGRVRITDSGGNPVTINKLALKSLLIEYTFTMPSI